MTDSANLDPTRSCARGIAAEDSKQNEQTAKNDTAPIKSDLDSQFQSLIIESRSNGDLNRLLSLPTELHTLIFSFLPWRSLLALRLTHSYFPTQLLPASDLPAQHSTRQTATQAAEITQLHALGYSNRNWTGFTQGWGTSQSLSLSPELPCYVCLRWLHAATHTTRLTSCAFTRAMATKRHDLAQSQSHQRVCIECGMRRGFYVRGNRVGHRPICYGCGKLGVELGRASFADIRTKQYGATRMLKGFELRLHYFCPECVKRDRNDKTSVGEGVKVVPDTQLEFLHWRIWRKYEKGMAEGKRYRLEKGKKLRAERGIVLSEDDNEACCSGLREPPHLCPMLKQKRWCLCWRGLSPLREHEDPSFPYWIW